MSVIGIDKTLNLDYKAFNIFFSFIFTPQFNSKKANGSVKTEPFVFL